MNASLCTALALLSLLFTPAARAEIPDFFEPVVVSSPFSFSERLFDLTPAFQKARQLHQPLLVYLGASDCPPCRDYTLFLERHKAEMKPLFAGLVLVDIRTWLRGATPVFRIDGQRYSVEQFKALVGDTRAGFYYPSWWLLASDGHALKELPRYEANYATVEAHRRLLQFP
jgi:thiol-disulfide isomerase/thioredoxin